MSEYDGFLCEKCGALLPDEALNCPKCGAPAPWNMPDEEIAEIEESVDSEPGVLKFSRGEEEIFKWDAYTAKGEAERREYLAKKDSIILTTTPSLEGYRIDQYIDVISVDIVFKVSLADAIDNRFEDAGAKWSFKGRELRGSTFALEKAKDYARKKLIAKAYAAGADAIVGVDFESNVGSTTFARVSINGTAVKIHKVE